MKNGLQIKEVPVDFWENLTIFSVQLIEAVEERLAETNKHAPEVLQEDMNALAEATNAFNAFDFVIGAVEVDKTEIPDPESDEVKLLPLGTTVVDGDDDLRFGTIVGTVCIKTGKDQESNWYYIEWENGTLVLEFSTSVFEKK